MDGKIIIPIPDRNQIAEYAEGFFNQVGRAIEIGVWEGEFASANLKKWTGEYHLCDNWAHRLDGSADKNMEDVGSWNGIKKRAIEKTSFAADRIRIHQGLSVEVAKSFPDGYFDWIYIDALHNYESVKADLNAWYPKLRKGGLLSGDDYGTNIKPLADRWEKIYGSFANIYQWGTIEAVNEFCLENQIPLGVTWLNDQYRTPAWYLIK